MNPRYVILAGATLVAGVGILLAASRGRGLAPMQAQEFDATVITTGLDTPWDMTWGPDSMIWLSERGGRISRIDAKTGRRTTAGEVDGVSQRGESGLTGIALHPDFPREPWLYAMHLGDLKPAGAGAGNSTLPVIAPAWAATALPRRSPSKGSRRTESRRTGRRAMVRRSLSRGFCPPLPG
jgi:hypothetical protein